MSCIVVTPTRGDRPEMLANCMRQIKTFNSAFNYHCLVDFKPKGNGFDLTERIFEGFKSAVENKISWVVIVEDDDFYPDDYLHKVMTKADTSDFIGCEFTFYYNIKHRIWERLYHPNRSSLFTTAFRVSAMLDFDWKRANKLFLDIDLWKHARKYRRSFIDAGAVGIKGHGFGLAGGKGHTMKLKNQDPDMKWLGSKVSKESLEFYKSIV